MQANNQSLPPQTDLTNKKIQHYSVNRSLSIRPDNLLHFHVLFMLRGAACSRISQTQRGKAGRGVLIWVDCAPLHTALPSQPLLRPLQFVFVSSFSPLALVHWLSFNGPPFWLTQGPIPFPCIQYSHYKLISLVIVLGSLIGYPSP